MECVGNCCICPQPTLIMVRMDYGLETSESFALSRRSHQRLSDLITRDARLIAPETIFGSVCVLPFVSAVSTGQALTKVHGRDPHCKVRSSILCGKRHVECQRGSVSLLVKLHYRCAWLHPCQHDPCRSTGIEQLPCAELP